MSGPLKGVRVIEIAGIGPGPFAAMLLADMGAEVVRVDRADAVRPDPSPRARADAMMRGRRSVAVDLKDPDGVATVLRLVEQADALIEGFRPGVMERLGIGPDECAVRNPRLVFGRMTGWGQTGPYGQVAGHDINYIALAGVLGQIRRPGEAPIAPLNLVGDFGGGGMLLAYGVVCALFEAQRSGRGQVVDAAMVDGAALLTTFFWGLSAMGLHDPDHPGTNLLDGGAPFYGSYACADGRYVSIGSLEPQFYALLLRVLGLEGDPDFARQNDRRVWLVMRARLAEVFAQKSSEEWCALLEHTDACFAPVLSMREAADHPHNVERATFVDVDGVRQPAPAPRFSRTIPQLDQLPAHPGEHTRAVLGDWGFAAADIDALFASGAIR